MGCKINSAIAFDGTWHRTEATGLTAYAKLLGMNTTSAARAAAESVARIVKIKTVGDQRTITDSDHVENIDLTRGTPDKITDAFGNEQTVDLYWDEVNKKVCGTAKSELGNIRVTHEILDGRLVLSFTSEKQSLEDKSAVEIKIISEPEGEVKTKT